MRRDFKMFTVVFEVLMFSSIIGNSVGMFVGLISQNYTRVLKCIPYFFLPLIILAGYFSNTGKKL
jgi:ABC-type microcin C transport system permease subunit YejE